MQKHTDIISKATNLLIREIELIAKGPISEFGYRERIRIERGLFLTLKMLCCQLANYNLQGFAKPHREDLLKFLSKDCTKKSIQELVEQIFQLKIFIVSLSSENAYVRGDAFSRVGVDRSTALNFVKRQAESILEKINLLYTRNFTETKDGL